MTDRNKIATLETINNDCLNEICQYLDFSDVLSVATTCSRLHEFANDQIFPQTAKRMKIRILQPDYPIRVRLERLAAQFEYFGSCVEHLTLNFSLNNRVKADYWRRFENVLELCPNLNTLCIHDAIFNPIETHIQKLRSLSVKELELDHCTGSKDWCEIFKCFTKLEKLSLINCNQSTSDIFGYCTNLSNFTLSVESFCRLATVFDLKVNHIQYLKLINTNGRPNYQSVDTLLTSKMPELKYLAVQDDNVSDVNLNYLAGLPNLKLLHVQCGTHSVNSLLRKLSDHGLIEDLTVYCGIVHDETDAAPLIFNHLRNIKWLACDELSLVNILKALTMAQIPQITSITIVFLYEQHVDVLLAFLKSKITLNSLHISCSIINNPFAFVRRVIEILQMSTPNRPFFKLHIDCPHIGEGEVSLKIHF